MSILTQFAVLFVSPFGKESVGDEMNRFLKSHRIINIEKRLVDGESSEGFMAFFIFVYMILSIG
jgi:hypothetical protein